MRCTYVGSSHRHGSTIRGVETLTAPLRSRRARARALSLSPSSSLTLTLTLFPSSPPALPQCLHETATDTCQLVVETILTPASSLVPGTSGTALASLLEKLPHLEDAPTEDVVGEDDRLLSALQSLQGRLLNVRLELYRTTHDAVEIAVVEVELA